MEKKKTVIGIQGGIGSFNEKAIKLCLEKMDIGNYKIDYLYTTKNVLSYLSKKKIDLGFFAIYNSLSGLVEESIKTIPKFSFQIVESVTMPIKHSLMKRKDIEKDKIKKIMAHPQVLLQCKESLKQKYPNCILLSGAGDLIDTAKAAEALSKGKLENGIAVLGNKALARLYNLKIIEDNLQDNNKNFSTFLLVRL